MKRITCNCGYGTANVAVKFNVRVMGEHRTEERTGYFCQKCADLMNNPEPVAPREEVDRFGQEGITAHLEQQMTELVSAVDAWSTRNREDAHSTYIAAFGVLNIARNISADMGDLATLVAAAENRQR